MALTKKITIFNHKGGVGKTTLTVNIAAALAKKNKRVLLVDTDPQCNLSSYLLRAEILDDLLDRSDTARGRTIWSALKPLCEHGKDVRIVPLLTLPGHPRVSLLPGDIQLSRFEQTLGDAWTECLKRRPIGFRTTTAISDLISDLCRRTQFDYVFYDPGPNIGPLNRVLLLDSDYFIIPGAADLFSVRALTTLGQSLKDWIVDWETIAALAPRDVSLLRGTPQYLGYILQGFRIYRGLMSSTASSYVSRFERHLFSDVVSVLKEVLRPLHPKRRFGINLGSVQDYGPLVLRSQEQNVPIMDVKVGDKKAKQAATADFRHIAERIIAGTKSS
jgi:cellulose biosynthesis protein BcsQ